MVTRNVHTHFVYTEVNLKYHACHSTVVPFYSVVIVVDIYETRISNEIPSHMDNLYSTYVSIKTKHINNPINWVYSASIRTLTIYLPTVSITIVNIFQLGSLPKVLFFYNVFPPNSLPC